MTSTKFFDAFSLVVTRGHSWSLVVNSWSLVVTRGHSWSFVVTRGHSCVLLDTTIHSAIWKQKSFKDLKVWKMLLERQVTLAKRDVISIKRSSTRKIKGLNSIEFVCSKVSRQGVRKQVSKTRVVYCSSSTEYNSLYNFVQ